MTQLPGLAALVVELAASVGDVETRTDGGSTTWLAAGRPFALLADGGLEVRLDPVVGAAARRTPDTSASGRGAEWVRFAPPVLDQYAEDRARAWFTLAYRRAVS